MTSRDASGSEGLSLKAAIGLHKSVFSSPPPPPPLHGLLLPGRLRVAGGRPPPVRAALPGGAPPAGGGVRPGQSQPDRGAHRLQPGIRSSNGETRSELVSKQI